MIRYYVAQFMREQSRTLVTENTGRRPQTAAPAEWIRAALLPSVDYGVSPPTLRISPHWHPMVRRVELTLKQYGPPACDMPCRTMRLAGEIELPDFEATEIYPV